jgi:hypothetical protein
MRGFTDQREANQVQQTTLQKLPLPRGEQRETNPVYFYRYRTAKHQRRRLSLGHSLTFLFARKCLKRY